MRTLLESAGADDNLRFLLLEVRRQLERTRAYMASPLPAALREIRNKDDHIDNLRDVVSRKCFHNAASVGDDPRTLEVLRDALVVAANLENIADHCEALTRQFGYLEPGAVDISRFEPFVALVMEGLGHVEEAVFELDIDRALRICRIETKLDAVYASTFASRLAQLDGGEHAQTHVTAIFVAHYFERMGDALQNIGEAVLSAALGEKIKIGQFRVLEESLEDKDGALGEGLSLSAMAESKSGCRIGIVSDTTGEEERQLVFKHGRVDKIARERDAIEAWHELTEGVAPRVHSFRTRGDAAGLLLEYLPGRTLEELVIGGERAEVEGAVDALWSLLETLWQRTRHDAPADAGYVAQLRARLPDVLSLHPEFGERDFTDRLEDAEALSLAWPAPFQVQIHGDLNVDNVLYDAASDRVHLVDLHRTRPLDYAQDVSVLLVSLYRIRALKRLTPRHASWLTRELMSRVRTFAGAQGDEGAELRVALGLLRSLVTSTRFVLDREQAAAMFERARLVLDRVLDHEPTQLRTLELPERLLLD